MGKPITELTKVRDIKLTVKDLIDFEEDIKTVYEAGDIKAPVHLSGGNEENLIDIFQYVHPDDWVFSSWRNHYHALLHGLNPNLIKRFIFDGKSVSISSRKPKFFRCFNFFTF